MILKYRLTARDLLAFNLYHFHRHPLMLLLMAGAVLPLLWRIYAVVSASGSGGVVVAKMLIAAGVLSLLVWVVLLIVVALTLATRLNSNVLTDHVLSLTGQGVVEETPNTRIETSWAGIQKIRRSRNHLFLYIAAHLAHVVPRRAFDSARSMNDAFELCLRCKHAPAKS
jgi:hypothetical protein